METHCQQAGRSLGRILPGIWLVLLLASSLAVAPGCRKHEPLLKDLGGLDQFTATFNEEKGRPRIVLLLSPT